MGRHARYGPFGCALHPQLPSYETDEARWDGAGSRWAAVTDECARTGLAIITCQLRLSCPFGCSTLNLLRAPAYPDPDCDRGKQAIRFQMRQFHATTTSDHNRTECGNRFLYPGMVSHSDRQPTELDRIG